MSEFKLDVIKQTRLVHYDNWEYKLWVGPDGLVIDYLEDGKVRESFIIPTFCAKQLFEEAIKLIEEK